MDDVLNELAEPSREFFTEKQLCLEPSGFMGKAMLDLLLTSIPT